MEIERNFATAFRVQTESFIYSNKVVAMNIKNIAGIAVLVLTVAFAIQMVQQNDAQAKSPVQGTQVASQKKAQNVQAVEYATLSADLESDQVTWLIGGNDRVRTETVKATYRRLGGNGRGSFADLLNQVGANGWNLVQKDGNNWIFSRLAR